MANFLTIFGALILVMGLITSKIAARFSEFDTTPYMGLANDATKLNIY